MNKKIIIGIIGGALALVIIVVASIAIASGMFKFKTNESSSEINNSSQTVSTDDKSGNGSSSANNTGTGNTSGISEGKITIGNVSGKAGETVTVPVKISGNPGIMAYMLNFKYDSANLTYSKYIEGDFLKDYNVEPKNGIISFVNVEDNNVDTNGTILNLVFKINDNAKSGDYEIILETNDICNYDEVAIIPTVVNGKVTVK